MHRCMHRRISVLMMAAALVLSGMTMGVGAVGATATDADSGDSPAVSTTTDSAALSHVASVNMTNQTSGGTTVTVQQVYVPDGGFVTIHDGTLNEGGPAVLSSVRGSSSYLSPGNHTNVTVRLDDPIENTTTLVAMPHKDTDGDRIYEFVSGNAEVDGPYTADGEIVVDPATVTASATVSFSDQPTDGTNVVVDRTELANGGFLAIHDATLLDGETFDSVRGVSGKLGAGVHEDVRVTLDEPLEENATLIPMPHRDTDDDDSYDFVTSEGEDDGPYVDDGGNIVLTTGAVTLQETSTVSMANETSGGHLVTVDEVFLPNGGFVTAHDINVTEGAVFDSVRGTSHYLGPGYHENVHIVLDEPFTNNNVTVVPMAHKDTDGDEEYDFVTSEGEDDGPYTEDGSAVIDTATLDLAANFHIANQPSDGTSLVVEHVDLSEDGYVTVHDASLNAGAVTDSVRGSSEFLEAGYYDNVTVTLDDPLRQSTTVVPMAHRETDGDETYDFVTSGGAEDGPVTTSEGDLVIDTGKATVTSQVTFESQTASGTNVTVQSATLHDGGFVTIHDASLLEGAVFDSVRGTSAYLGPGTHENVTVSLGTLEESGTFVAMPHRDTDGDETYDFVTSEGADDSPYVAKDIVGAPATVNVSDTGMGAGNATATVTLNNQTANGQASSVNVASATLSQGGFVTIHDGTLLDGDTFDSVRGTSDYLEAGSHENISVALDEPYTESGTIIAMPHLDSNGNQAYDFVSSGGDADSPYTTSGGDIVLDPASLTVRSASVTFEDQETEGDSLTVASVTMSQGGFVTIHDATVTDNAITSVRGTSGYLEAGTHEDVEVSLDDPVEESGQFFAMPHLDTDGDETYDFVSSEGADDAPYVTAESEIVLAPAQVTLADGATPTDTEMGGDGGDGGDGGSDDTPETTESGGQPGFGVVVAVLALLGAALLARRS
jgi:PGF-CTERM protein